MNVNTTGFRQTRISPSTDGSAYILDLMNGTSWQGANVMGFPCPGLDDMDMGLLPDEFRESAASAVYVVKHYETPIAWRDGSGGWHVPAVKYSATTNRFRGNIIRALSSQGIEPVTSA